MEIRKIIEIMIIVGLYLVGFLNWDKYPLGGILVSLGLISMIGFSFLESYLEDKFKEKEDVKNGGKE